jgi:hypothetical protein
MIYKKWLNYRLKKTLKKKNNLCHLVDLVHLSKTKKIFAQI